ncbi:MAG: hypothetical protein U0746_20020 [Gemmataceae bacterium]
MMAERVTPRRRGSYGVDAPYAPAFMAVAVALEFVLAFLSGRWWPLLPALLLAAVLGSYLYTTPGGGSGGSSGGAARGVPPGS